MQISLLPHNEQSLNAFASLAAEWGERFWKPEAIVSSLNDPHYAMLLATEGEEALGLLYFREIFDTAEILYIYVAGKARRRKIGHFLLAEFLKKVSQANIETVFLEVRVSNIAAQHLYRAHSFRQVSLRPHYYNDGEDALIFERHL